MTVAHSSRTAPETWCELRWQTLFVRPTQIEDEETDLPDSRDIIVRRPLTFATVHVDCTYELAMVIFTAS